MFGMGFTEILLIAVIAILFLGPDKLPSAMVDIAKFFRSVKNTIGSVKDSLEQEMQVADLKKEALAYKQELLKASESVHKVTNVKESLTAEIENILKDEPQTETTQESTLKEEKPTVKKASAKSEEVTFKKKKRKKTENLETKEENKDV